MPVMVDYFLVFLIIIMMIMRAMWPKYEMKSFEMMMKMSMMSLLTEMWLLYVNVCSGESSTFGYFNNQFIYSPFIMYLKIFICMIGICFFIVMLDYFKYEKFGNYEVLIVMLLCIEGMFLLLSANDLFMMYITLELQSMALYMLASLKRYSNISVEAGLKYFIYGSFASGMILYGISLIYGYFGVTDFFNIYLNLYVMSQSEAVLPLTVVYGFLLMLAGMFFKLGMAPFHLWVADVYEGVPTLITYFFAVFPKISILFLLFSVYVFVLNPSYVIDIYASSFMFIFFVCAILSIFIGSIGAIYQTKMKRLLAYSAIANMGFILLGLSTVSYNGVFASMYYFLVYIIGVMQIFLIMTVTRRQITYTKMKNLVEFVSLTQANFMLSFMFVFVLLSFAGMPPLAGFYGKIFIFFALMKQGQYLLALVGVLFSVFTCVYYISLVRFIWFNDRDDYPICWFVNWTERQAYLLSILFTINLCLFIFQGPVLFFIYEVTLSLIECMVMW